MFYSQFILAKKGPLGTIWIAAHLERKLRKNQVADTDIGVSVDSILFPDMPIALRLSSHLLLGVVRIYSKKVNYLFDDCSEALLKIKQAFRSTAVDLPPEESTAPYHSITLPETFDLDDFELPDSDIYQGNYVDHHISSREQITLQDNMDGVVFTSSQFGLDERFGDGETSGVVLDQEFLDKVAAAGNANVMPSLDVDPQTSIDTLTPLKHEENHDSMILDQIEGLDDDADFIEDAHAPCTPGLLEEPNLLSIQETSACEDNLEPEDHNLTEVEANGSLENICNDVDHHQNKDLPFLGDKQSENILRVPVEEGIACKDDVKLSQEQDCLSASEVGVVLLGSELSDMVVAPTDGQRDNDLENGVFRSIDPAMLSSDRSRDDCLEPQGISLEINSVGDQLAAAGVSDNTLASPNLDRSCTLNSNLDSNSASLDTTQIEDTQIHAHDTDDSNKPDHSVVRGMMHDEVQILQPCSNHRNYHSGDDNSVHTELPSEISNALQGEGHPANDSSQVLEENCSIGPASFEIHLVVDNKSNNQVDNLVSEVSRLETLNFSPDYDILTTEKLLSVPEGISYLQGPSLVETTPQQGLSLEGEGGDYGSKIVSGKKRSFTESTLTVQSLDSVESLRVVRSKRTAEFVPDDDDLLSSILVGRKSSALKVKPSPLPEITSMKRPRSVPRISASKRKVLLDETMVLHGDTIRQQLIDSEDIRRVRKKAPCTRSEISMIQKQFLQDEIFNEPIFTGLSIVLLSLHNQTYDLREIRVSQNDANSTNFEAAAEVKTCLEEGHTANAEAGCHENILSGCNDGIGTEEVEKIEVLEITPSDEARPFDTALLNENKQEGDHLVTCSQVLEKLNGEEVVVTTPYHELLENTEELEIHRRYEASADATNAAPNHVDGVLFNVDSMSADVAQFASLDITGEVGASMHTDFSVSSPSQNLDLLHSNIDGSAMDMNVGDVYVNKSGDKKDYDNTVVGPGSQIREDVLLEENFDAVSFEGTKDIHLDNSRNDQSSVPSTFYPEVYECSAQVTTTNQAIEEIGKDEQGIVNYDEFFNTEGCNATDSTVNGLHIEEGSHLSEVNMDANGVLLTELEKPSWPEACPLDVADADIITSFHKDDPDDFDYSAVEHDTEFLNVDDDEVAEADDDYVRNNEETCVLDNSGWSSRTRAVAKYLQTLFDKEAERGRKALPMDSLLAGKTRKEASRMFFEALVLKTRDYIHVEQERPFGSINMMSKGKLMKSDY